MKAGKVQYSVGSQKGFRFDASFHMSEGLVVRRMISSSPYDILSIGEVAEQVFYGIRAKRIYVSKKEYGIPFFSSSDILRADLDNIKLASKSLTPGIEQMTLQKGWTLISRSGTIGNCAFANAKHAQKLASEHVIRLVPNNILRGGLVYAYLASKYGHSLLTQGTFGGVIQHIEPAFVESLPIPNFPHDFQEEVDVLIQDSARLREEAIDNLASAEIMLKEKAGLRDLSSDDYDYYGHRSSQRKVSCFTRNIQEIGTTTINAFNHSERIRKLKAKISCPTILLREVLKEGRTYGTSGLPNIEVKPGHGIMLINQKDMFDNIVKGKWISSRGSDPENVLEYGEILIACDGTLGENELFCRAVYVNEDLKGSYVSSHFLRLKVNDEMLAGYLFCWLNSDYGFRLIRNTQAGTKLCHPINKLFLDIPIPIIGKDEMQEIDRLVREAHTKRHLGNQKELKAISMVEQEIEKWNN
jgi:hypothetical protein